MIMSLIFLCFLQTDPPLNLIQEGRLHFQAGNFSAADPGPDFSWRQEDSAEVKKLSGLDTDGTSLSVIYVPGIDSEPLDMSMVLQQYDQMFQSQGLETRQKKLEFVDRPAPGTRWVHAELVSPSGETRRFDAFFYGRRNFTTVTIMGRPESFDKETWVSTIGYLDPSKETPPPAVEKAPPERTSKKVDNAFGWIIGVNVAFLFVVSVIIGLSKAFKGSGDMDKVWQDTLGDSKRED